MAHGESDGTFALAVVISIEPEGESAFYRFLHSQMVGRCEYDLDEPLRADDLLLIDAQSGEWERADASLWPTEVGFVQSVDNGTGVAVVQVNGALVRIEVPNSLTLSHRDWIEVRGGLATRIILPAASNPDEIDIARFRKDWREIDVSFADFAGHASLLDRARTIVDLPLRHREALARMNAPQIRGVLFAGPPGVGKTHLARIIARETQASLYMVAGPELVSKFVGDSEAVIRAIFDDARQKPAAIIFFDELDAIAPARASTDHTHDARLVTQLLSEMDGPRGGGNVLVIASTNREDALEPALLRPGRFDWVLRFPKPALADRVAILRRIGAPIPRHEPLPYLEIARASADWSAAEIRHVWTEASLIAVGDGGRERVSDDDLRAGFARAAHARSERLKNGRIPHGPA